MGLNHSESGSVQLQAVTLEGQTGSLGELKLKGGGRQADLFVAELPPTLLSSSNFSIVVHGVDGEGRKLARAAPQAATVMGSLLEVREGKPRRKGVGLAAWLSAGECWAWGGLVQAPNEV